MQSMLQCNTLICNGLLQTEQQLSRQQPTLSKGPAAKQAQHDAAYLRPEPLWEAYRRCAARSRKKNAKRRAQSVALLQMPGGRKVEFTSENRARIDPSIIARIR